MKHKNDADWRKHYDGLRHVPGFGECGVTQLMYTYGLYIKMDDSGTRGVYHFPNYRSAMDALAAWDGSGDPPGPWIKFKGVGGPRKNPKNVD